MATTLDPCFNIAYRFGAIFLSEPPPGGPVGPTSHCAAGEGHRGDARKWQYIQDIGFVEFWARKDYKAAAASFERASKAPGAAWFLKPLAATTLAQGGQR